MSAVIAVALVRELARAGLSGDELVAACDRIIDDLRPRTSAERVAKHRASKRVTTNVTIPDYPIISDTLPVTGNVTPIRAKKVPPHPPKEILPLPNGSGPVAILDDGGEAALFRRGREILGTSAGGLVKNLLKVKNGVVSEARAALEASASKGSPKEYIGAAVRGATWQERVEGIPVGGI